MAVKSVPPEVEWLASGLAKPGKTGRGLAAALKIDPSAVSRILSGARRLQVTEVPLAAAYLGQAAPAELLGTPPELPAAGGRTSGYTPPPEFFGRPDLPVYAAAEGGTVGELLISSDPIEFLPRPNILEFVPDAYAIVVTGESMIPAFKPGQTAWVNPRLPPMRGEEAIFWHEDPDLDERRALIKELISWDSTNWRVQQWNPQKEIRLNREEWPTVHRVVGKFNRK